MIYDDNNHSFDNHNPDNNGPCPPHRPNAMATASLVLGIIGLLACFFLYLAIPFAVLGILFAILSRGRDHRMHSRAKVGLGLSIAGLVISVALTAYVVATILPYARSGQLQQYLENYLNGYYDQGSGSSDNGGSLEDWLDGYGNGGSGNSTVPYEDYGSQPADSGNGMV